MRARGVTAACDIAIDPPRNLFTNCNLNHIRNPEIHSRNLEILKSHMKLRYWVVDDPLLDLRCSFDTVVSREKGPIGGAPYIRLRQGGGPTLEVSI